MQPIPPLSDSQRRRWRREPAGFTVLGRFPGGDRLGRAVNLSERGLGAVFQGCGYRPEQPVEVQLVTGAGVRRGFGVVCSARPRGQHTRVGIRTFGFVPGDENPARAWAGRRRGGGSRRGELESGVARWGPESGFSLVSPGGARAMDRDRLELARDVRARYAVREAEAWPAVVRRFLRDLPASPLRGRFLREQFRVAMLTHYPAAGGSEIRGEVVHSGDPGIGRVPPCVIHLDHFAVACSDRNGIFAARGIPRVDDAIGVPLRIANHAVLSTSPVAVHLPPLEAVVIEVELPVVLTGRGEAGVRPAADSPPAEDPDLVGLRALVDQL